MTDQLDYIRRYDKEDNLLANCIRFLTIDAIGKAKSGHYGMPLGMADVITVLCRHFLSFNPNDPLWKHRDRLVISNGHGSMLLYAMMYLAGYADVTLKDLQNFRKISSKAKGHPEYGTFAGVETSTGPLGQGLANAVGMALAAKISMTENDDRISHKIYCTVGDGCLMEGVSQEAINIASYFNLDNLIVIFDNNGITIDGNVSISSKEVQSERFRALGWEVIEIDAHDTDQIKTAFEIATSNKSRRPVFIDARSIIGFGDLKNQNTCVAHGSGFDGESISEFKKLLGWDADEFEVPARLLSLWRKFWLRNKKTIEDSAKLHTHEHKNGTHLMKNAISALAELKKMYTESSMEKMSLRSALGLTVSQLAPCGLFIFGSADLGNSTMIKSPSVSSFSSKSYRGNYINFGIREHGMAGVANGIALYGGKIPFISTFLTFSDYMRPAIRMAALMGQKVFYAFTHDSIQIGEDGPTHQPIEQLDSLRLIPNLNVFRPCDIVELCECIEIALNHPGPSVFVLSRQDVNFSRIAAKDKLFIDSNHCARGGYTIYGFFDQPHITLIASGAEVPLCISIAKKLTQENGLLVDVVSIPCVEIFNAQPENHKLSVLKEKSSRVCIEFSTGVCMSGLLGGGDLLINIKDFGKAGTSEEILKSFQLDFDSLCQRILSHFRGSVEKFISK